MLAAKPYANPYATCICLPRLPAPQPDAPKNPRAVAEALLANLGETEGMVAETSLAGVCPGCLPHVACLMPGAAGEGGRGAGDWWRTPAWQVGAAAEAGLGLRQHSRAGWAERQLGEATPASFAHWCDELSFILHTLPALPCPLPSPNLAELQALVSLTSASATSGWHSTSPGGRGEGRGD